MFKDVADSDKYMETFMVESWAEHLRQHERVTMADLELEKRVHSFHAGPDPPKILHYIYAEEVSKTE